ncbi:hypothetical protein ACFX1Z_012835 [Malus domestica]
MGNKVENHDWKFRSLITLVASIPIQLKPKPRIDYTLTTVGGSLTALLGISNMIDDTVESIVIDMLQWPHKIVVPNGGVHVDTSEVVVYTRPLFKVKTKAIDNNLNPVWDQTFELIAKDTDVYTFVATANQITPVAYTIFPSKKSNIPLPLAGASIKKQPLIKL